MLWFGITRELFYDDHLDVSRGHLNGVETHLKSTKLLVPNAYNNIKLEHTFDNIALT